MNPATASPMKTKAKRKEVAKLAEKIIEKMIKPDRTIEAN